MKSWECSKWIKNIFLSCLLISCLGCGMSQKKWGPTQWAKESEGRIRVLCTTAMIHGIVERLGGDQVEVITLIFGELNPHAYQLVKGDDEKLSGADIIFASGLGLEHGASLKEFLSDSPKVVSLGDLIAKENPDLILHLDDQIDPHIWMDISLWAKTVPLIANALSQKDPEHANWYQGRADIIVEEMLKEHQAIRQKMDSLDPKLRYLVTSHDAFNYFARAYLAEPSELADESWMERCVAPEGLAPEGQISALDIRNVIQHMGQYHITTLFPESNINKDSLKKIVQAAKEMGLDVKICDIQLYGDAMGPIGSDGGTYLGMIRHNAATMYQYWGEQHVANQ